MVMPPQLLWAKRPKRSEPRPIVEQLPRLDIGDLTRLHVFPANWYERWTLEMPFKFQFLKTLVISLQNIEVNHYSGYNQRILLCWIRTGFGGNCRPRPLFICRCGHPVTKLYYQYGSLKCRRCTNAVYASQVCSGKQTRAHLQAKRLQTFLQLKSYMSKRNRQRIKVRIPTTPKQELKSKRLSHHSILLPQSNYRTYGAMHWR
jgi:hypothetical protein